MSIGGWNNLDEQQERDWKRSSPRSKPPRFSSWFLSYRGDVSTGKFKVAWGNSLITILFIAAFITLLILLALGVIGVSSTPVIDDLPPRI